VEKIDMKISTIVKSEIQFMGIMKNTEDDYTLSKKLNIEEDYFYSAFKTGDKENHLKGIYLKYLQGEVYSIRFSKSVLISLLCLIFLITLTPVLYIAKDNVVYITMYSLFYFIISVYLYNNFYNWKKIERKKYDSNISEKEILNMFLKVIEESESTIVVTDIDYLNKNDLNNLFGKLLYLKEVSMKYDLGIKIAIVGNKKSLLVEHLSFIDTEKKIYGLDDYVISILEQNEVKLSRSEFTEFYKKILEDRIPPYKINKLALEYVKSHNCKKEMKKRRR
jgi:hypothetical protein